MLIYDILITDIINDIAKVLFFTLMNDVHSHPLPVVKKKEKEKHHK